MARKSSKRRRSKSQGSVWPAVLLLGAAVALVALFAGSALLKALGSVVANRPEAAAGAARTGPESARASAERARLTVEVWNGSGNGGAGQRVAEALRDGGFRVGEVRNADRSDYGTTLVLDRKGNPRAARDVVQYLHGGYALMMRSPVASADVRVVVGRDHHGLRLTP